MDPDRIAVDYAAAIDVCKNASEAADLYADALLTYGPNGVTWRTINGAVLNRWAMSTLVRIKRDAWRQVPPPRSDEAGGGA